MSQQRGIPMVGRGMTGAIPGTDPLRALLAKEDRERRQAAKRRHHALIAANRVRK
jgi:hypothetical protein